MFSRPASVEVSSFLLIVLCVCVSPSVCVAKQTQGLQRSAELDVTRYSALEATNVQLRRQVEQLELLCKEQAEAAQQLSKRQQVRPSFSIKIVLDPFVISFLSVCFYVVAG